MCQHCKDSETLPTLAHKCVKNTDMWAFNKLYVAFARSFDRYFVISPKILRTRLISNKTGKL